MNLSNRSAIFVGALVLFISGTALAVGPGSGLLSKRYERIGACMANSISVKYRLDSLMGEPTVVGAYRWEGEDCRLPASTVIWLEVRYGGAGGFVRLAPTTPGAGEGYGMDTTGSPSWGQMLCGYSGTQRASCLDPATAKKVWENGEVVGFNIAW